MGVKTIVNYDWFVRIGRLVGWLIYSNHPGVNLLTRIEFFRCVFKRGLRPNCGLELIKSLIYTHKRVSIGIANDWLFCVHNGEFCLFN